MQLTTLTAAIHVDVLMFPWRCETNDIRPVKWVSFKEVLFHESAFVNWSNVSTWNVSL